MAIIRRQGVYITTKTYDKIDCIYRRWASEHSYDCMLKAHSLTFKVVLECHHLDPGLNVLNSDSDCLYEFEKMIKQRFMNKTIVALDDPEMPIMQALDAKGLISISLLPSVGAERISEEMFNWFKVWLMNSKLMDRVDVRSVEVTEDWRSSAVYAE